MPPGTEDVLTYTPAFGDFKQVLGSNSIKSFHSLSPRNYSIVSENPNGSNEHLLKVKGLSLKSANCCDLISTETYCDFLNKRFQDEVSQIYLPQVRLKIDKKKKTFNQILTRFDFSNDLHAKRYILKEDNNYETHPFGFKFL